MPKNETKSLFNNTNSFRRKSQTWVATRTSDIEGFSPVTCAFESLESRVLMSAAYPQAQSEMDSARLTHSVIAKSKAPAALAPVAPAAPSALSATPLTFNSVQLNWTAGGGATDGFIVYRGTDGTHFTQIAKIASAIPTTYTDKSAASFHTYYYEVAAYKGTALSPAFASAAASTSLAAVTSFTATATGPARVQLAWTINGPLAAGYNVLRSTDGKHFSQLAQLSAIKIGAYTDTAVSSNTAYFYEVQAYSGNKTSAVSSPAAVTTPLKAPTALTATLQNGAIALVWTGNDKSAAGYYVLRSSDGKTFAKIGNVSGVGGTTYSDTSTLSGHNYTYEVQAYAGNNTSAASTAAAIGTPLAAPSGLTATALTATSVRMSWTDNDVNAAGYYVLRSADGIDFTRIAALAGEAASTDTDTAADSGQNYTYEVQAVSGSIVSTASSPANASTPLAAPGSLTAVANTPTSIMLAWTDKDPAATGYNILRSTDGITFTQLAQVSGASANSYTDVSVTAGQSYYYQVQASNASVTSAVSNTARATTPSANVTNGVSVTTRFGDELVIIAAGTSDAVSITESGGTLTITGNGQTVTDTAPAGGTFIYTRGGSNSINIDASVTSALTIDSIDAAATIITSYGTNVNAWIDSTDTEIGTAAVHSVASFAGSVSKAPGASLPNPADAGTTSRDNLSLFGTGPVAADVNQGESGDCYFLSSLAAFANTDPQVIINSAVDLGDGTYAVEFHSNNSPVYVRVNNSFTTGGFGGYTYAHPGVNNTIWASVFEKAFAYFRTGANTYASISSGWMGEVYTDLGVPSADFTPGGFSDNALFNLLSTDLSNGDAVTIGTQNAPNLVSDHAYTLLGVTNVGGVNRYVVRNPWGVSGDGLENSQGMATLTYAQFVANFVAGTIAMN